MPETHVSRPLPQRPANGLLAWQATIGYIHKQYGMEAHLVIRASAGAAISWGATALWGDNQETIADKPSLMAALRDLWRDIDARHLIFASREALIKRPVNYGDQEWLDLETQVMLERLLQLLNTLAPAQWQFVATYTPSEVATERFVGEVVRPGRTTQAQAATLRDLCRELYRQTAQASVMNNKDNER